MRWRRDVAHLAAQAARCAAQLRMLRNDVVGYGRPGTCRSTPRGVERIDVAGDDRLQLGDDLGADQERVDGDMRARRMAALAFELDHDVSAAAIMAPGADGELADRQAGVIVHAVDFVMRSG